MWSPITPPLAKFPRHTGPCPRPIRSPDLSLSGCLFCLFVIFYSLHFFFRPCLTLSVRFSVWRFCPSLSTPRSRLPIFCRHFLFLVPRRIHKKAAAIDLADGSDHDDALENENENADDDDDDDEDGFDGLGSKRSTSKRRSGAGASGGARASKPAASSSAAGRRRGSGKSAAPAAAPKPAAGGRRPASARGARRARVSYKEDDGGDSSEVCTCGLRGRGLAACRPRRECTVR